jgi:hypothetical protein
MTAATLLAGALAGGADELSPRDCWLCLAYLYSTGNSAQIQIDAAIAAGCDRLSDGDIEKCLAYMLTSGSSPVPGPVNLIPAGAHYNDWAYDVSNLLQPGGTYKLTWGTNELDFSYGNSVTIGNPGAGQTSTFTYPQIGGPADLDEIGAVSAGLPVTATIYAI